ncbi:MAG TPA: PAS domain-containing protein [bacterium]
MIDRLSESMLKAMYETLPIEITIIDANDEVIGWNKHNARLFKRPLTSMGANFRDCHPQQSLSKVVRIVEEMRSGKLNHARFWIDLAVESGKTKHKILIEFYALRDESGRYLGCMECTQDVEEIRNLYGEKRILDK